MGESGKFKNLGFGLGLDLKLSLSLAVSLCVTLLSSSSIAAEIAGRVVSISGKVLARTVNEQGMAATVAKELKVGSSIRPGMVINTSSTSSLKMLMTDRTIIDLGPSSLFIVDQYLLKQGQDRQIDYLLDYGKVRTSVNQPVGAKGKLQLRTRSATLGVRGTEFIVDAGGPFRDQDQPLLVPTKRILATESRETKITVTHGKVEVVTPQHQIPVYVTGGSQLVAPPAAIAAPPKIVKLSTDQIRTTKAGSKQQDRTFFQAVAVDTTGGVSHGGDTLAAVSQNISTTMKEPVKLDSAQSSDLPGTFGADFGIRDHVVNLNQPPMVTLKVVFRK